MDENRKMTKDEMAGMLQYVCNQNARQLAEHIWRLTQAVDSLTEKLSECRTELRQLKRIAE